MGLASVDSSHSGCSEKGTMESIECERLILRQPDTDCLAPLSQTEKLDAEAENKADNSLPPLAYSLEDDSPDSGKSKDGTSDEGLNEGGHGRSSSVEGVKAEDGNGGSVSSHTRVSQAETDHISIDGLAQMVVSECCDGEKNANGDAMESEIQSECLTETSKEADPLHCDDKTGALCETEEAGGKDLTSEDSAIETELGHEKHEENLDEGKCESVAPTTERSLDTDMDEDEGEVDTEKNRDTTEIPESYELCKIDGGLLEGSMGEGKDGRENVPTYSETEYRFEEEDALEVACQVAKEVEQEVEKYADCNQMDAEEADDKMREVEEILSKGRDEEEEKKKREEEKGEEKEEEEEEVGLHLKEERTAKTEQEEEAIGLLSDCRESEGIRGRPLFDLNEGIANDESDEAFVGLNHLGSNHVVSNDVGSNHAAVSNHVGSNGVAVSNHVGSNDVGSNYVAVSNHLASNHVDSDHVASIHLDLNHVGSNYMEVSNHVGSNHVAASNHVGSNHAESSSGSRLLDIDLNVADERVLDEAATWRQSPDRASRVATSFTGALPRLPVLDLNMPDSSLLEEEEVASSSFDLNEGPSFEEEEDMWQQPRPNLVGYKAMNSIPSGSPLPLLGLPSFSPSKPFGTIAGKTSLNLMPRTIPSPSSSSSSLAAASSSMPLPFSTLDSSPLHSYVPRPSYMIGFTEASAATSWSRPMMSFDLNAIDADVGEEDRFQTLILGQIPSTQQPFKRFEPEGGFDPFRYNSKHRY